ncbi:MAG: LytR/AlgR family response regulator transcription factor [Pyrinomonadaceae bacterium]
MPLRILIVDDEPGAREIVREMLNDEVENNAVRIVGECSAGHAAVKAIQKKQPDIVFLDVQMPEMDGFQVLSKLRLEKLPIIIFVTAYDRYALRAFDVHALDYLLKPFDHERFKKSFKRAKTMLSKERAGNLNDRIVALLEERGTATGATNSSTRQTQFVERLVIKGNGRVFFIRSDEIEWIEAEGNYVELHVGRNTHLYRESISTLEQQLDSRVFQRIHRSIIVNVEFIKELHPLFRGEFYVIMHDDTELKLSHSYRDKFLKQVGGASIQ